MAWEGCHSAPKNGRTLDAWLLFRRGKSWRYRQQTPYVRAFSCRVVASHRNSSFQSPTVQFSKKFDRLLRSCMGHPVPLRSNSATAGSCTGVLSFGDCPIRQVPCVWHTGLYTSGRIGLAVAHVCGLEIAAATVYCPRRGLTFPKARDMSDRYRTACLW